MGENGAPVKCLAIFGGVPIPRQAKALGDGVLVLTATPGRLMDLMNQDKVRLDKVDIFVLDEADRMLDMGFVNDVRKVASLIPKHRQTVLFSATMPNAVAALAATMMDSPVRVEVAPQATTAERVVQSVLHVPKDKKRALLTHVMRDASISRVVVFTRTKHGADRVTRHLVQSGINAGAIHGDKAQNQRQRTLNDFRDGKVRVLVATDIAARGIDVDGVTHVINFDLPNDAENYVHRIGRTARAGEDGFAIAFCDAEERDYLDAIEKMTRQSIPVMSDHPFHAEAMATPRAAPPTRGGGGKRPPRLQAQGAHPGNPKKKGHRPTDGKRHSDKGHSGHGHGEPQGHGTKKTNGKASAKPRSEPTRSTSGAGGGQRPLRAKRRGGNASA
jgi:ATP-dependent RNA helicase RhlE